MPAKKQIDLNKKPIKLKVHDIIEVEGEVLGKSQKFRVYKNIHELDNRTLEPKIGFKPVN